MRAVRRAILPAFILFLAVGGTAAGEPAVRTDGERLTLSSGDRVLLEYHYSGKGLFKPYVAALNFPAPGGPGASLPNPLRDAPPDHLHHHGLMLAFNVDGVEFWGLEDASCGRQVHAGFEEHTGHANWKYDDLRFAEYVEWRAPPKPDGTAGELLLLERRELRMVDLGPELGAALDWVSVFRAPPGRTAHLTGREYHGLGARFLTSMDRDGRFLDAEGRTGVAGTNAKKAAWGSYAAPLPDGQRLTFIICGDPANPRGLTDWFTMESPFAYLCATIGLDEKPLDLEPGKELRLHYGVGALRGDASRETMARFSGAWLDSSGRREPAASTVSIIRVHAGEVLSRVTPWMTGSCIEDVNHEIYGGIYSQMVFGEGFEEPGVDSRVESLGLRRFGGLWSVGREALEVGPGAGHKVVKEDLQLGDGEVEVDLFFPGAKTDSAGIIARVREPGEGADAFIGYEVSLGVPGFVRLGRHRKDWQHFKDVPHKVPAATWIHLKAAFHGPEIVVSVDGEEVARHVDDHPLEPGAVGLRTWNAAVRFRDLRVRSGGKEVLLPLRRAPEDGPPLEVSGSWKRVITGSPRCELAVEDGAWCGKSCQRIAFLSGEGSVGVENRGLNGWGLALAAGKPYEGWLHLRADADTEVHLVLAAADGRPLAEQSLQVRAGGWQRHDIALGPREGADAGAFRIELRKPGVVRVDQVLLQPGEWGRFRGLPVRRDIAEGLLAEGLTALRLGGWMINAGEYRWKSMIGPRESRAQYRGNWYPWTTNGWGIVEFLDLCERSRFLPVVSINTEETPEDAADLAEYSSGAADKGWGRRRALDGHPDSYDLRFVEIGNEETLDAHYAERFALLSDAMVKRDAGLTFVIAAWFDEKNPVARRLVEMSRGKSVLWDVHVGGDGLRDAERDAQAIGRMRDLFREWCPEAGVRTCILEENGGRHDLQRALGHARMVMAMQRLGDFVLIDCPANCLQPLGQNDNGWDQGQLFFTPSHAWGMPPWHAQAMLSAAYRPSCVKAEVASPAGALDATALRSEDGRSLVLEVTNIGDVPARATVRLEGFEAKGATARLTELSGELTGVNTPQEPERIAPRERVIPFDPAGCVLDLPARSFTVVRIE